MAAVADAEHRGAERQESERREPAHHRLYGRARGKALTAHQKRLMEDVLPRMRVDLGDPTEGHDKVWLEVGFGAAHHLLHQARSNPDVLVLGAEPFLNGVAKAVAGAHAEGLGNLRLHPGDARDILANLPDASLARAFVLYPDPWPKARHNKRRLVQEDFLAAMARVLRPGATLRFASDVKDYVDWVLARARRTPAPGAPAFHWHPTRAADFLDPPEGWVETTFERRAKREGRVPHYVDFVRG